MSGPQAVHSAFGASSSHRWIACPGSVAAQAGLENKSGEAAAEGTFLHAVTEHCLRSCTDANLLLSVDFEYDDHGTRFVRRLEADQADAVQLALDTVRADCERLGATPILERKFHLIDLDPDFYGTCDCVLVDENARPLVVIDYKFGRGLVDIRNERGRINSQVGYYAIGAGALSTDGVECVIIQPRAYHPEGSVRRTYASQAELQALAAVLSRAARLARNRFPPRHAGSHCKFCRAAGTCSALQRHVASEAQALFDDSGSMQLPPIAGADIPRALANADTLRDWIAAIEDFATAELTAGRPVRGYTLQPKRATRKWKDEGNVAADLSHDFGLDISAVTCYKVKTVAQIEKLIPKYWKEAFSELWTSESSGFNLVKQKDQK